MAAAPITSNKISAIFGQRLHRRLSGKLATVIDQIEHGHHVFRAYFKHAFLKLETLSQREFLPDRIFGMRAGLVAQERTGRISRCSLTAGPIFDAAVWLNRYSKYWQAQFDMLAATLEDIDRRGRAKARSVAKRTIGRRKGRLTSGS